MSVENSKVIDYASIDKNGHAVLTISDHLEWDDNNEHLLLLQNKINAYLTAVESGNLYDDYPNAKERDITIKLVAKYEPNNNAKFYLDRVRVVLESAGYAFEFTILKSE
ncbi:MAG TPA: hypothetical protein PKA46_15950 [Ferruginibacter sp.]|nr:hypothetical protein [Ferruginibacter sp.]